MVRIFLLLVSDLNIGPDEGQYWWWSLTPDFGYFSKPPMIAWLIGATTALFGHAEWAVRLGSPLVSALTTIMIFLTARKLFDSTIALWAAVLWATLPVILLSAGIISTDVPLLFFWATALFGFVSLVETQDHPYRWALFTGVMIGLGMLSKYAMIYFPLAIALSFLLSTYARQAMKALPLLIMAAVALIVFTPNILWNAANEFQTLNHTQANANLKGELFNLDELAEYLISQLGVVGPILFALLVWGIIRLRHRLGDAGEARGRDLLLLSFTLPPLGIICLQAFLSRANANWAMTAYPAGVMLLTVWMHRAGQQRWMKISVGLHVAIALVFFAIASNLSLADRLGLSNSVKRVRGWPDQAADILRQSEGYDFLVIDDRELMGSLLYYLRDSGKPLYAWDLDRHIDNHYEAFHLYQPKDETVFLVSKYPKYLFTYVEFDGTKILGKSVTDLGVPCLREYTLVELFGV